MQSNYPNSLKSAAIAKILIPALWIRLGLGALSVLFSLIEVILPPIYTVLAPLDGLQAIVGIAIALGTVILALIWIRQIHQDLPQLYGEYPISPNQSLARFMIPFYNIWGIWDTLNVMAQRFIGENITENFGRSIKSFLPAFYGVAIASNVLNRTLLRQQLTEGESPAPFLLLVTAIVDLGLSFILLQLGIAIANGVASKASSKIS